MEYQIVEGYIPEGYEVIIPNCRIIPKPLAGAQVAKQFIERDGTKAILVKYKNGYCAWSLRKK